MAESVQEAKLPSSMVSMLARLAEGLVSTFGNTCEVVVHDFGLLPNSIVAIAGDITGRTIGDPMTNFGFRLMKTGKQDDALNYRSTAPDGRQLKSSTLFIRDENEEPIGCLCVNIDLTEFTIAKSAIDRFCKTQDSDTPHGGFTKDIHVVLQDYLEWALRHVDVPVQLMQKEHKLQVIERLDEQRIFQIRGAVDLVAKALLASKYTVYNYLDEVRARRTMDS